MADPDDADEELLRAGFGDSLLQIVVQLEDATGRVARSVRAYVNGERAKKPSVIAYLRMVRGNFRSLASFFDPEGLLDPEPPE